MITATFVMRVVENVPIEELLEETSREIGGQKEERMKSGLKEEVEGLMRVGRVVLGVGWVFFLAVLGVIVMYIRSLKEEYVRLTMFISLLNE